jgi:hypothetical protein
MKTIFFCVLAFALFIPVHAETIRLSEPVATDATSETFGAVINNTLAKTDLASLLAAPEEQLGKTVLLETKISKVCQKKGCFFIAQQNAHTARVSFRDYGFFIPTDSSGKTVLLSGELVEKHMTQAQADHFSSDIKSESEVLKAGKVYEIVADAIQIPRT